MVFFDNWVLEVSFLGIFPENTFHTPRNGLLFRENHFFKRNRDVFSEKNMSKCSKWAIFSQLRQIVDLVIVDFLYLDFRRPCSTLFFFD